MFIYNRLKPRKAVSLHSQLKQKVEDRYVITMLNAKSYLVCLNGLMVKEKNGTKFEVVEGWARCRRSRRRRNKEVGRTSKPRKENRKIVRAKKKQAVDKTHTHKCGKRVVGGLGKTGAPGCERIERSGRDR